MFIFQRQTVGAIIAIFRSSILINFKNLVKIKTEYICSHFSRQFSAEGKHEYIQKGILNMRGNGLNLGLTFV